MSKGIFTASGDALRKAQEQAAQGAQSAQGLGGIGGISGGPYGPGIGPYNPKDTDDGLKELQKALEFVTEKPAFVKHDAGKPRFSLIPPEALAEVAKVFTHGASKYPARNYLIGTDWTRYLDATYRHLSAWSQQENLDESGFNHLAHAAASILILLTLQLKTLGKDDR